jgi:hypothetical protein
VLRKREPLSRQKGADKERNSEEKYDTVSQSYVVEYQWGLQ